MSRHFLQRWKSSTNLIFWGIVILSVFGWMAVLLGYFTGIVDVVRKFDTFFRDYGTGSPGLSNEITGFYAVFYLMQVLSLAGWAMYLAGLHDFRSVQPTEHTKRLVAKLNTACWLGIAGIAASMLNGMLNLVYLMLFMAAGWVLTLLSYIKFQGAFAELKHCTEWDEVSRRGAANLRLSANLNIWLIFWPVVCIGVAMAIGGSAWQEAAYIKEHALEYALAGGVWERISHTIENYKVLIVTMTVLLTVSAVVMSVAQFVLRLMGWRKVHNGFLTEETLREETSTFAARKLASGFCHKCDHPLSEDASFCANCGTRRIIVVEEVEKADTASLSSPSEMPETPAPVQEGVFTIQEDEEDGNERRRTLLTWGGIFLGIIVIFLIIWFATTGTPDKRQDTLYELPSGDIAEIQEENAPEGRPAAESVEPKSKKEAETTTETVRSSENTSGNAGREYGADPSPTRVYTGAVNGKYAIEMTLTTNGGKYYNGEYFYTKNKTPIQLRGQITDGYHHLLLEEYVGLDKTGSFDGTLTANRYYGTWTNADGDKTMPFSVTLK